MIKNFMNTGINIAEIKDVRISLYINPEELKNMKLSKEKKYDLDIITYRNNVKHLVRLDSYKEAEELKEAILKEAKIRKIENVRDYIYDSNEFKEYMAVEGEKLINIYTEREFGNTYKFEGEDLIPLAHTTDEDDETIEIQVDLDLRHKRIIHTKGMTERSFYFRNLEDFKDTLRYLDFDSLIYM